MESTSVHDLGNLWQRYILFDAYINVHIRSHTKICSQYNGRESVLFKYSNKEKTEIEKEILKKVFDYENNWFILTENGPSGGGSE